MDAIAIGVDHAFSVSHKGDRSDKKASRNPKTHLMKQDGTLLREVREGQPFLLSLEEIFEMTGDGTIDAPNHHGNVIKLGQLQALHHIFH